MEKYKNYYRIPTTRLANWNYGWNKNYFVTIVTRFHKCHFGEIRDGVMHYSELGNVAVKEWMRTPEIRRDMNIKLDAFQVMPNHIHGIVKIGLNRYNSQYAKNGINVTMGNKFGPQRKNLSSLMGGFKSAVTKYSILKNLLFDWHPRFFDFVINDDIALFKIRNYINNNVRKWHHDRFNRN